MLIVVCSTCGKRCWEGLTQSEIVDKIWHAVYFDCSDCILKEARANYTAEQEENVNDGFWCPASEDHKCRRFDCVGAVCGINRARGYYR